MSVLLLNAVVIATLLTVLWLISLKLRDVSIIDLFWGLGFVIIAWITYADSIREQPTCYLLPLMVTVWGLRLSGYLTYRNWGHGEDKRYAAMRKQAGPAFAWRSLITVFWLQGLLMWLIAVPLQLGIPANRGVVNLWTYAGVSLWGVGLLFESIGDWQLLRFKAQPDNQGKVLDRGLWRYTRHPNYFGDCLVWWGFWLIAVSPGLHFWTIFSPVLMSILLMFVSGVSLLERDLKSSKPEYAEYIRRTSPFFPWFPR